MWNELLETDRNEYKRMILAFSSLTEIFCQKDEGKADAAPIINSKYQESVFQRSFKANVEDIGNTSYDASIHNTHTSKKYLIGIKTFGISSGYQKIAQFKTNHDEWSTLIDQMQKNSKGLKSKEEIDRVNEKLYLQLAKKVSELRNRRLDSSISNLKGFKIEEGEEFESVYHVLMPSRKGDPTQIYVGETSLDSIGIESIKVRGCTTKDNPTNFNFSDGKHEYRYTSADSQLLMDFKNNDIILEKWPVKYVDDAYSIFSDIATKMLSESEEVEEISESHCWKIKIEPFSGFNMFFAVGSKIGKKNRKTKIKELYEEFGENAILDEIIRKVDTFLCSESHTEESKQKKVELRYEILNNMKNANDNKFTDEVTKLLFRSKKEVYIPIPKSSKFHSKNPDFFVPGIGSNPETITELAKEKRKFTLVFEPSGDKIEAFVTQDNGKGIESWKKQSILGEWILHKIFQLKEYEQLNYNHLNDMEINGIRLYKTKKSSDVHLQFIWIDDENPPEDYIKL